MPGLAIPSYPNPASKSRPLIGAYARIAGLALDVGDGAGRMILSVHPSADDVAERPADQVAIALGQETAPGVHVATLVELMADPEFAAAYAVVSGRLYREATKDPRLAAATILP